MLGNKVLSCFKFKGFSFGFFKDFYYFIKKVDVVFKYFYRGRKDVNVERVEFIYGFKRFFFVKWK